MVKENLFLQTPHFWIHLIQLHPDIATMVDWALKPSYLLSPYSVQAWVDRTPLQ